MIISQAKTQTISDTGIASVVHVQTNRVVLFDWQNKENSRGYFVEISPQELL
jgi:hypothetical protein